MNSQPRKSRIRVQKSTEDSLQILLLPQGPDRPFEVIAVLWTAGSLFLAGGLVWTLWKGSGEKADLGAFVAVVLLQGLVGWGLIYLAFRRRSLKSVIAVNRTQFLIETRLGQRSSVTRIPLDHTATALLNGTMPNPGLIIQGQHGKRPVSTSLMNEDQRRLVTILNRFFDAELSPEESWSDDTGTCARCGMPIPGSPVETTKGTSIAWVCEACVKQHPSSQRGLWEPLTASQATGLSPEITIHADGNDQLDFSYIMLPAGQLRLVLSIMFPVALAIMVGAQWSLWQDRESVPLRVYLGLFFIWVTSVFLFLMTARIRVRLTKESMEVIWGRGPVRFRSRRDISEVTDCRMVQGMRSQTTTMTGPPKVSILHMCGIIVGTKTYPLVTLHEQKFSQRVVRLIRTFFVERLQRPLPEPVPYQKGADVTD